MGFEGQVTVRDEFIAASLKLAKPVLAVGVTGPVRDEAARFAYQYM